MGTQNFEGQVAFYHNIFVYCAIAALIFLAISVTLFFVLKISKVFSEFTGRDAKRAIEQMVAENALSGSLTSLRLGEDGRRRRRGRTGALATGRLRKNTTVRTGNLTQSMVTAQMETSTSGKIQSESAAVQDTFGSAETDVLDTFGSAETDVLDTFGSAETDVLDSLQNTAYSGGGENAQQEVSETMVLEQNMIRQEEFVILRSIVDVHTDEVI